MATEGSKGSVKRRTSSGPKSYALDDMEQANVAVRRREKKKRKHRNKTVDLEDAEQVEMLLGKKDRKGREGKAAAAATLEQEKTRLRSLALNLKLDKGEKGEEEHGVAKAKAVERKALHSPRRPGTRFNLSQKHFKKLFESSSKPSEIVISQPLSGYTPSHKTWTESYVECMLSNTLKFAGLTEADCRVIVNEVHDRMSHAGVVNSGDVLLVSPEQLGQVQIMHKECSALLDRQQHNVAAIRIQALVRGFLVRRRIGPLLGADCKEHRRKVAEYNRSVHVLMEKEEVYSDSIRLIVERYLYQLRETGILTEEEENLVFGNIESIALIQQGAMEALSRRAERWPFVSGIADVYLQLHASLLDLYIDYATNFDNSQTAFVRMKTENPAFAKLVAETNERESTSLNSLLSLPLSHLSRICKIMQDIATKSFDSVEKSNEKEAVRCLTQVAQEVRGSLLKSDSTEAIINVERRIIGGEQLDLLAKNRRYIMDGSLQGYAVVDGEKGKVKQYTLFLFNDMVLVTQKKRRAKPTEGLTLCDRVHMRELGLMDGGPAAPLTFCLRNDGSEKKHCYWFSAETGDVKEQWLNNLKSLMERFAKNRVFGDSLEQLLTKEKRTVPWIMEACCTHLLDDAEAMATEGIFRITGDIAVIYTLRDMIDSSTPASLNLKKFRVHEIAGVLKLWLRQLTEPLMGWDMFEKMVALRDKYRNDDERATRGIPALLAAVNPVNLPTIEYLLKFLYRVSKHSAENMMTPSNLSIVFGPIMARPKVDTIESTVRSPFANQIVMMMIEQCLNLFP